MKNIFYVLVLIFSILNTSNGQAQLPQRKISEAQKQKVIKRIEQLMIDKYIFPELGAKMAAYIRKQQKNNAYAAAKSPDDFRYLLTRDLRAISKDGHISVSYNPARAKRLSKGPLPKPSPERMRAIEAREKGRNFGFEKVERLMGNVGYLDLRGFYDHQRGAETAANAFGFLANTQGIIIDLRRNGGGSPRMVQLLCSYFFDEKPVHLSNFYWREGKGSRKEEYWSLEKVKGKKMPNKPLFILTSRRTFSAAEDFSYSLQAQKRVTIVGETTGGGAHPVRSFAVGDMFVMAVPIGRSFNPITKTDWEGVGVIPEIKISADKALDKAHLEILRLLKNKNASVEGLDWAMHGIEAKINPVKLPVTVLKAYAGEYTNRKIILKESQLYYQRPSTSQNMRKLIPLTEDLFAVEGLSYFRIQIKKDKAGKVIGLMGKYDNGRQDLSKKGKIIE
ncbi:hypothetical protein BKI52_08670 [marine bacterium AO1-C]|nr:hypothetical protein BKI52_08670 [marine bacterium AO1-C]